MNTLDIPRLLELGIVSVSFITMLRWMMTRFERELKNIRHSQHDCGKTIAALSIVIVALQKQLLSHDLTVHGINSSTGDTKDERAKAAIDQYNKLQIILNETSEAILRMIDK